MYATKTKIDGLLQVFPDVFYDYRGEYIPVYEKGKLESLSVFQSQVSTGDRAYSEDPIEWQQDGISRSRKNVFRGFHGDANTIKLTTVLYGEAYSVIIDMRKESETFMQWDAFLLSDKRRNQLLIPAGCGNSCLALTDEIVYMYKQTTQYGAQPQFTVRWDDPAFAAIPWPITDPILSERDLAVRDLVDRGFDLYAE